ncbi:hypothetical protein PCL_08304 [Purpureocillium lilacinum]|uniref:Uncharacterized protein n=1 Tax=Purpureocillium lilacinum TaxID=33203 RepID=A0A2U3EKM3_PURLI|nr:hypothetical protein Purlil1_3293 [Purpureocillium lilacinum]PWI74990.1 hypothetical protein PCL_08304 [Purpureocillium lilacinum]
MPRTYIQSKRLTGGRVRERRTDARESRGDQRREDGSKARDELLRRHGEIERTMLMGQSDGSLDENRSREMSRSKTKKEGIKSEAEEEFLREGGTRCGQLPCSGGAGSRTAQAGAAQEAGGRAKWAERAGKGEGDGLTSERPRERACGKRREAAGFALGGEERESGKEEEEQEETKTERKRRSASQRAGGAQPGRQAHHRWDEGRAASEPAGGGQRHGDDGTVEGGAARCSAGRAGTNVGLQRQLGASIGAPADGQRVVLLRRLPGCTGWWGPSGRGLGRRLGRAGCAAGAV